MNEVFLSLDPLTAVILETFSNKGKHLQEYVSNERFTNVSFSIIVWLFSMISIEHWCNLNTLHMVYTMFSRQVLLLHLDKLTIYGCRKYVTAVAINDQVLFYYSFDSDHGLGMRRRQRFTTVRFESMQSLKKFGKSMFKQIYKYIYANAFFCTK